MAWGIERRWGKDEEIEKRKKDRERKVVYQKYSSNSETREICFGIFVPNVVKSLTFGQLHFRKLRGNMK